MYPSNLSRSFFLLGLFMVLAISVKAQIHIDSLKDVGVGTTDPEGAKMRVYTVDDSIALRVYSHSSDSSEKYGIYNDILSTGLGPKIGIRNNITQNSSSTAYSYGTFNRIVPHGSGEVRALFNFVTGAGTGDKFGIHNTVTNNIGATGEVTGIYNSFRNSGTSRTYGIYNYTNFLHPINDRVTGIYNYIRHTTSNIRNGEIYGIDTNVDISDSISSENVYGIRSIIGNRGESEKYGIYSQVTSDTTSGKPIFGMYSEVFSQGDTASIYGVHSTATTTDSTTGYGIYAGVTGDNATNSWAGYFDGNVHCTLGMWQSSDRNVKENIEDFTRGLELINYLRPVTFNYRHDLTGGAPKEKQYGFIAQEIEEFLPELVKDVKVPGQSIFKTDTKEVDEEENGIQQVIISYAVGEEPSTKRKAVNYTALIPILVKAIQEQQEETGKMHEEVVALKSESESQKRMITDQQAQIDIQKNLIAELTGRIEALEKK